MKYSHYFSAQPKKIFLILMENCLGENWNWNLNHSKSDLRQNEYAQIRKTYISAEDKHNQQANAA